MVQEEGRDLEDTLKAIRRKQTAIKKKFAETVIP